MILLTGGTGFLGRHIVQHFIESGRKIRLICRNPEKADFQPNDHLEIVEGDILDQESLERAFEGVDQVIHAAALISFWPGKFDEMQRVNVEGTQNIVDMCLGHGIKKLVYVSSVEALGKSPQNGIVNEDTNWKDHPGNLTYAKTKYLGEKEVIRGIQEGLNAAILNPASIIGPGTWDHGSGQNFKMIYKGLKYYMPGAYGAVSVKDVVRAIDLVLNGDLPSGSRFLLSAETIRFQDLCAQIAESLGKPAPSSPTPLPMLKWMGIFADLFSKITGKEPKVSRETALFFEHQLKYDGSKIVRDTDFVYSPIEGVVKETGKAFLAEMSGQSKG